MRRIASIFCLTTACLLYTANTQAIGVDVGPFSLTLPVDVEVDSPREQFYYDPICRAILERDLVMLLVETEENKVQQVVVEPYAFGYNKDGNLILQGVHVKEARFDGQKQENEEKNGTGYIGGVLTTFKSDGGTKTFPLRRVIEVRVLENTDFRVSKDKLKKIDKENGIVDPICELR